MQIPKKSSTRPLKRVAIYGGGPVGLGAAEILSSSATEQIEIYEKRNPKNTDNFRIGTLNKSNINIKRSQYGLDNIQGEEFRNSIQIYGYEQDLRDNLENIPHVNLNYEVAPTLINQEEKEFIGRPNEVAHVEGSHDSSDLVLIAEGSNSSTLKKFEGAERLNFKDILGRCTFKVYLKDIMLDKDIDDLFYVLNDEDMYLISRDNKKKGTIINGIVPPFNQETKQELNISTLEEYEKFLTHEFISTFTDQAKIIQPDKKIDIQEENIVGSTLGKKPHLSDINLSILRKAVYGENVIPIGQSLVETHFLIGNNIAWGYDHIAKIQDYDLSKHDQKSAQDLNQELLAMARSQLTDSIVASLKDTYLETKNMRSVIENMIKDWQTHKISSMGFQEKITHALKSLKESEEQY